MTKGLMGRYLSHETTIGRLREKAKVTDDELTQLRAWKVVQEKKLKMAEGARDEYLKRTEELSKVLEDKEKEIRQAKVDAVREYRDSDDLLLELGSSYNDGFDDALRQVKSLHPDLDLSSVNISVPEQTSVQPARSNDTDQLFGDEGQVDGAPVEKAVVADPSVAEVRQEGGNVQAS